MSEISCNAAYFPLKQLHAAVQCVSLQEINIILITV